jgi:hypothetical protein
LPYKGLDALKARIKDPTIRAWADKLKPKSHTKLHSFILFWEWAKKRTEEDPKTGKMRRVGYWSTAREMLADHWRCMQSKQAERPYKHLEIVKKYLKGKGTSPSDRKIALSSIRAFYRAHKRPLQELDSTEWEDVFEPTAVDLERKRELTRPLTTAEVAMLVRAAKMPYKAVFLVMFQGGMDAAALEQFSGSLWHDQGNFDVKDLDRLGPTKIGGLIRTKTMSRQTARGGDIDVYYTFLSEDGKRYLKQWLEERREMLQRAGLTDSPYLFLNWRRGGRQKFHSDLAPVSGNTIGKTVTELIKRLGLVHPPEKAKRSSRVRYYFHGHELRDCFKSQCSPLGVSEIASEFFMGHNIDRLGYNKSPYSDEGFNFFRGEYKKVTQSLDIISYPPTAEGKFQRKETLAEINRQNLLLEKVPRKVVDGYSVEQLASMTVEEMRRLIRTSGKDIQSGTATDGNGWEHGQQKVVAALGLREWVERGWLYVATLPTGEVVIKLP